jgi:NAD(P)-dependent dehydrogenase (short-subunit alcohol dehydrogenase family)
MKIVLVTGGNRGIGLEICRQLDELGYKIILGSRNPEKGTEAAKTLSEKVIVKQLDITNEESIQQLFTYIDSCFGKLDVLINNAAIGEINHGYKSDIFGNVKNFMDKELPVLSHSIKSIIPLMRKTGIAPERENVGNISLNKVRLLLETNLFGAWRMIQVFLPLLSRSDSGRIINISSGMGELDSLTGEYPSYSLSKAYLNALTIMFANELKNKAISVNAMCPGWVRTDSGGRNAPRSVSQGADTVVWLTTEKDIPTGKFFRDRKEIKW